MQTCSHCEGSGFIDTVANIPNRIYHAIRGPRTHANPELRKWLEKNGSIPIAEMKVSRKPIIKAVDKVLNFISLGQYERIKGQLNYDDMFHLMLKFKLQNGQYYVIQKNHVVEVDPISKSNYDEPGINVRLPHPNLPGPSIDALLYYAEKQYGPQRLWVYNARTQNCQRFLMDLLGSADFLTPEISQYILQDANTLIGGLPSITKKIIDRATDIASRADILLRGEGKQTSKRTRKLKLKLKRRSGL